MFPTNFASHGKYLVVFVSYALHLLIWVNLAALPTPTGAPDFHKQVKRNKTIVSSFLVVASVILYYRICNAAPVVKKCGNAHSRH